MNKLCIFIATVLFTVSALAAEPIFNIQLQGTPGLTPPPPLPLTKTTLYPGGNSYFTYRVTNNTAFTLNNNGVVLQTGIYQNTCPLSPASACAQLNGGMFCDRPFSLAPGESCLLNLSIFTDELLTNSVQGGPQVCNQINNCARSSVPAFAEQFDLHRATQIAVGTQNETSGPMLAQLINNGTTWSVVNNINNLPEEGYFASGACYNNICIAVGEDDSVSPSKPLLAQTTNGGVSWSTINIPNITSSGYFHTASCNASMCIAAGENTSNYSPLLAQSTDSGATWNIVDLAAQNAPITNSGYLQGASCNSKLCVAVGSDQAGSQALLLQTGDNGANWTQIAIGPKTGYFNAASCSDNICIAAGSVNSSGLPLLVKTPLNGNWSSVDLSQVSPPVTAKGIFFATSCSDSICVAAGGYGNNPYSTPLLIQSTNIGQNWTAITSGIPSTAKFVAASCNGDFCIAAGHNQVPPPFGVNALTDIQYQPLLMQRSTGTTWTQPSITNLNSSGYFYTASCNDTICFAGGGDYSGSSPPILVQLTEQPTWSISTVECVPTTGSFGGSGGNDGINSVDSTHKAVC